MPTIFIVIIATALTWMSTELEHQRHRKPDGCSIEWNKKGEPVKVCPKPLVEAEREKPAGACR